MAHGIRQTVPPAIEPVALTLAKNHLRLDSDFTVDDTLIGLYISAAREYCERHTNTAFYTQTWQLSLDHFPWPWGYGSTLPTRGRDFTYQLGPYIEGLAIRLPKPRTLAVLSIKYRDATGTLQTLDPANYFVDIFSEPARIIPRPGFAWPIQDLYQPGSVIVTYTAGTFVQTLTEALTVPAVAPYIITPSQAATLLGVTTLFAPDGTTPVAFTAASGVLTVASAEASLVLGLTYTYGLPPNAVVLAILFLVAHWYQSREAAIDVLLTDIPFGVENLLSPFVYTAFGF
jgi:hypothetical protein